MSMELMNREQEKVSNGSLRSLVSSNTDMLHKVGSKLGELGAVRKEVGDFAKQVIVNNEVIILQLQTLINNDVDERNLLLDEFKKVVDIGVIIQKNTVSIFNLIKKEIVEKEKVQKKVDEEMKQLRLGINQRVKRQRYLWSGVGVLAVSLACCLGYICYGLNNLNVAIEKQKVKVMSNTVLPVEAVLRSNTDKKVQVGKGNLKGK